MKKNKPIQPTILTIRRSVLSLLFVALLVLGNFITVYASVGAGGSFANTNYRVQPGDSLIETGTDFNFVNNFDSTITVDFNFEAPMGVVITLPSEPVELAARSTYRIPIQITTTASTPVGTFPLRIVGRVVQSAGSGVGVSGSAGLNASITVQGTAPTTPPVFSLISRTQTSFTITITNNDPERVSTIYSLGINVAQIDIPSGESVEVTFSSLEPNTPYTIFAQSAASPRKPSTLVPFQVTTLSAPDGPPPATPPVSPPASPPSSPSTGGGGAISINVLVIDLDSSIFDLEVFDGFSPPEMTAYVSIRDNVKEISRIDLTNRVVITGSVNPNVVGRYELRYFLRYNVFTLEEVVVVNVRDTIAPQITSPAEVTVMVDEVFSYQVQAIDNYNIQRDLIISGFPEDVDTSVVGVQRFNVVVTDQAGNRSPFLFTVNVRERAVTPIVVTINGIDVVLNAIEGLFDETNYRVDVVSAANQPLHNSPSWTVFSGQTMTQDSNELVYVRVTDASGNTLIAALDITLGRVIPLNPDSNVISGDAWWIVLLRSSNILLWLVPLFIVLGAGAGLAFVVAKRRNTFTVVFVEHGNVVSKQRVAYGEAATAPNSGPWNQSFDSVTTNLTIEQIGPTVVSKRTPSQKQSTVRIDPKPIKAKQSVEKIVFIEPLIAESIDEVPFELPKKQPIKPPRKRRKTKEERYLQMVALEEDGVMDDDLLGSERLSLSQPPPKEVKETVPEEVDVPAIRVDERQIDLFADEDALKPPVITKKTKK